MIIEAIQDRERPCTSDRQLADLLNAHAVLERVNDRLASTNDTRSVLGLALAELAPLLGNDAAAVFRLESDTNMLRFVIGYEGDTVVNELIGHPYGRPECPVAVSDFPAWPQLIASRQPLFVQHDPALAAPPSIEYHSARGHSSLVQTALFVAGQPIGLLGLAFTEASPLGNDRRTMLDAVAKYMTLALQLAMRADAERTAAVAREQAAAVERRAAELGRANEALRAAIAGLSNLRDQDDFLAEMLRTSIQMSGAIDGAVDLLDAQGVTHAVLFDRDGLVPRERQEREGLRRSAMSPDLKRVVERLLLTPDAWAVDPFEAVHTPEFRAFHLKTGNRAIRLIPMAVGDRLVGWLGLGFADPDPPLGGAVHLLQMLADQMTMAVEMRRLSEEARESAVARERELAAEQRAARLAAANNVLRRSLTHLSSHDDLGRFLGALLVEAVGAAGAVSGAVFLHDPSAKTLRAEAFLVRGELIDMAVDPRGTAFRDPVPEGTGRAWQIMARERRVYWLDYGSAKDPNDWPQSHSWHNAQGHRFVGCMPMVLDENVIGFLGLCFDKAVVAQPSPDRLEICQSLAQQATLAVRLTRLAEEAKQAAVAREREAAAELRAAELRRANDALQAVIDSLPAIEDIGQFVPAALRAVASAFGATDCSYYEHFQNECIQLRYWFRRGQVLTPDDLLALNDDRLSLVRQLALGFSVPDSYLGTTPRERKQAVILDHWGGTTIPEFDAFAVSNGWDLELNVPVVVGEAAAGALVIFRPRTEPFTPGEITLAETLAKQLALATQAARVAEQAKEMAVVRERESATAQRAAELSRERQVFEATTRAAQLILKADDLIAALPEAFGLLGPVVNLDRVLLIIEKVDSLGQPAHYVAAEWTASGIPNHRDVGLEYQLDSDFPELLSQLRGGKHFWLHIDDVHDAGRVNFLRLGIATTTGYPIFVEGTYIGLLAFDDCRERRPFSGRESEMFQTISSLIGSVMHRYRLVDTIAREHEATAEQRARHLARTNAALKETLDAVVFEPELNRVLGHVLTAISRHLITASSALWLKDNQTGRFLAHLAYHEGQVVEVQGDPDKLSTVGWGRGRDLYFKDHIRARKPIVYQVDDLRATDPQAFDFFTGRGIHTLLGIPLLLGKDILGSLAIRFNTPRTLTLEELELAQAMAHQATMAIQLMGLAERAGQAAVLDERTRLAREIHDTLAQGLVGILMHARAAASGGDPLHHLGIVTQLAEENLAEARRSVSALRPTDAGPDGLLGRLRRIAEKVNQSSDMTVRFTHQGQYSAVPPSVEDEFGRIAQEAVTNAVKHSGSPAVLVELVCDAASLRMTVSDTGCGFEPDSVVEGRFGLVGISERAERIGAALTLISEPGRGTTVIVGWRPERSTRLEG